MGLDIKKENLAYGYTHTHIHTSEIREMKIRKKTRKQEIKQERRKEGSPPRHDGLYNLESMRSGLRKPSGIIGNSHWDMGSWLDLELQQE